MEYEVLACNQQFKVVTFRITNFALAMTKAALFLSLAMLQTLYRGRYSWGGPADGNEKGDGRTQQRSRSKWDMKRKRR